MDKWTTSKLLQFAQLELEETLREQQGMTFKVKQVKGRFIHTFCTGNLLSKMKLTPQDIVGRELKDILSIEIAAYKESFYNRAWHGEENITYEGEIEGVYYLASLRPIRKSGKVVEVIASCVDITERKRAEEELRATKELLESLIENSADGICITDTEGKVIRVNRAFQQIFGWIEKELVGKTVPIFPEHMKNDLEVICKQLQAGEKITNRETIRQRKDGEIIHVCVTVSPIKDKAGNVIALAGTTRDISERKRTEEFLRKSDKLNVVGQLAAGLAHEIRNPLTSLRGFLQLMQSGSKNDYYDIMIPEIDRISCIVSEFLIIAKPQVTNFQSNNITTMIQNVITLLDSQAILYNVQIKVEIEDHLPLLPCSEIQIKQVFINLLKNAIEAMPEGGEIHIVAHMQNEDHLLIRLIDQGDGIPEDLIQRLGEPFYTTKEKGTGLGLMMCYKIIEAHQGNLYINSCMGVGTTIDVVLPVTVTP
ncbi:PAS domain S-box protein [Paenibacillus sp. LMG 31456]|uniref:histidine kinase n=1 Tax=Paenibacillus foliorum TaxID=2654974 RepID=A0A972GKK3_9BACL|nr:PAS domain S-box protein [Paenibacillus foliorum]NOU92427.1 PAS domain S-box protein [Paenibacillus foliorum]